MRAYTGFAQVYDLFMDNVPYEEWEVYVTGLLQEYGVKDGIVLDLGCGTGKMTRLLQKRGYDMIGVDSSEEMLQAAMEQGAEGILYLCQDMREFELYGTVAAVVSICDAINYILEEDELREVFALVNNYLDPGGIFIFDFNTEYKYRELLGDQVIAEDRQECSFIWDNYYDDREKLNEYELTLFVKCEGGTDLYRKYQEIHYQKAYTLEQIRRLVEASGLKFVAAYDAYTKNSPSDTSERICVVARENRK